jgi:hypothetical protein
VVGTGAVEVWSLRPLQILTEIHWQIEYRIQVTLSKHCKCREAVYADDHEPIRMKKKKLE